jgi:CDP-diacylglycerol--glycerol-3-phosphate 3-phosphatidyltransferase
VYAAGNSVPGTVLVGLTLVGSLMVSYIRSRAEAAGLKCETGIFTRPERVIVLALGLLLSRFDYALTASLVIIVVFSFITVTQRMVTVRRQTEHKTR